MNFQTASEHNALLEDFAKRHSLAVDQLTEKQFAEAIRQAITCGDFVRHVRAGDGAQNVVYLPYERVERLQARVRELEDAVTAAHAILEPVTKPNQTPL